MRRIGFFSALLCTAGVAHASDVPLYKAAPDWVKLAPTPTNIGDGSPVDLIQDSQQRMADGAVWSYHEVAQRAASDDTLAKIGTIRLTWQPDHGDLIIHRVEILRDGQRIDLLKAGAKFTVLRREQQLEQMQIDGILTATMPAEGLRVGDVLDIAYSVTNRDPALKGNVQAAGQIVVEPVRIGFARTRLLWPDGTDIHWKAYPVGATPTITDAGGWHDMSFAQPVAKQPDLPKDVPLRYQRLPMVEATSFADWPAVSKAMYPLFKTDGTIAPGSPLAAEVDRIAKATSDPLKRAALALQLVQDKVRYLYNGMDGGNYVPQAPAKTWSMAYGDCKAKTLLLLAVLHGLKIDAEPILANIGLGDLVSTRLPSAAAFNHVLVHARVGGRELFLDGTDRGSHLDDIDDVPPFRWVLPLRPDGAALLQLPLHAPSRPDRIATIELDESAGINLPAPFTVTMTVRGGSADQLRSIAAQATKDQLDGMATLVSVPLVGASFVSSRAIGFDPVAGTATMTVKGVAFGRWAHEDKRYRLVLDKAVAEHKFDPDRSRASWKDMPVSTGNPGLTLLTTRIRLPDGGKGFTLDGDQTLDDTLAGAHVIRKSNLTGDTLTVEERVATTGAEIAPADIPAVRARLALAQRRLLRASTVPDYPPPWTTVEAAKRAHKFDETLARYTAAIANKPDEAEPYLRRANFLNGIFERRQALADLDKAMAISADVPTYLRRSALYEILGDKPKALADAKAAYALDPGNKGVINRLAILQADGGKKDEALALVQPAIDDGGKDKPDYLMTKAEVLARTGDKAGALAAVDSAIEASPGNPTALNERCWIKGTLNTDLDTALKDCTKSIELSDSSTAAALDSRAMVYFRMNRMDDAITDLNAALDLRPESPASLFMRGVVKERTNAKDAAADIAAARAIDPTVDETYGRYGIKA